MTKVLKAHRDHEDHIDLDGPSTGSVLSRATLVLNRSWQPVRIASAARCMIMLWNGTVKVVDPESFQVYDWHDWSKLTPRDGQATIRTVQSSLVVPEVVVLQEYDKIPVKMVTFSRRNLFRRDHYQCQYCGKKPKTTDLTIDHILPRSKGGTSTWENCVLACIRCNTRKGSKTLDEANLKLRRTPIRPTWTRLFAPPQNRVSSWSKFISEAYWNVELQE